MRKIVTLFLTVWWAGMSMAQNTGDLFRFSQYDYSGTARFNSMSGAFGSLGADASVASTNPGGLGLFRRSEFSFNFNVPLAFSRTDHLGTQTSDAKARFLADQAGIVITKPETSGGATKQITWSLGVNRLKDFTGRTTYEGVNEYSSLLDVYLYDVTTPFIHPDEFGSHPHLWYGAEPAWNAFLLDTVEVDGVPYYFTYNQDYGATQRKEVTTRGGINEWYFALAGDFNNRLFLGGTIGVPYINYRETSVYSETIPDDAPLNPLVGFTQTDSLSITGIGVNLKLGFVYRVSNSFRFGGAIHTPTNYAMTDVWEVRTESEFGTNGTRYEGNSGQGRYSYTMRTPWRYFGNAAWIFGKTGLLSVDYELNQVNNARFKNGEDGYTFAPENDLADSVLNNLHVIRAGTELRSGKWAWRFGGFYQSKAFVDGYNDTYSNWGASWGVGYRDADFFIDFAWKMAFSEQEAWLYDPAFIEKSTAQFSRHSLMIGIGFRWY